MFNIEIDPKYLVIGIIIAMFAIVWAIVATFNVVYVG